MKELSIPTEVLPKTIVFSETQKDLLSKLGFEFFDIGQESILSLKKAGTPFWSEWHKGLPIETITPQISQVAINPKHLFIPKAINKNPTKQLESFSELGKKISAEKLGVKVIMGSFIDYLVLGDKYKKKTGKLLYRSSSSYDLVETTTVWDEHPLYVGQFYDQSFIVSYRNGTFTYSDIKVMPLIVSCS